jgi:ABC-type lipoprotein export system ATPase subunit
MAPIAEPALVELRGVAKRYRVGPSTVHALDSVDVRIAAGEFAVGQR